MTSFQSKLRKTDGRLPGLAALRALLVAALVGLQSAEVSVSNGPVLATPAWILVLALPSALFFLAGYALAHSAGRVPPRLFLERRAIALVPMAVVAILFAAFPIGLAATDLPRRSYLLDADLWLFGGKVLVMAQARLPGLFEFNNEPWTVNANFWMVTATAAGCAVAVLAAMPRWRWPTLGGAMGALLVAAVVPAITGSDVLLGGAGAVFSGVALAGMTSFVLGALAVAVLRHVPRSPLLALAAGAALGGVAYVGNIRWQGNGLFDVVMALPVAYLALYAASRRSHFTRLAQLLWPALSGLPLFAFMLQQFWMAKASAQQSVLANLALSLPPAIGLSLLVHVLTRRWDVARWFPALASEPAPESGPAFSLQDWKHALRRQFSPGALARHVEGLVPRLLGAILFLLVVFGLMALVMLAMQRDEPGI